MQILKKGVGLSKPGLFRNIEFGVHHKPLVPNGKQINLLTN